jgi:mannitol-1-phosphate 5-dehydrogenase
MIGGSSFFKSEIEKYVINKDYLEQFIGFPDAAVDRIVPEQHHEDALFVEVEPFSEWVINKEQVKNKAIKLEGVLYVENLPPYIERKLFSVNTGHATVAYTGALLGYQTIDEAMKDALVLAQLKSVLSETGELLIRKWGFNREEHNLYIEKIITRFKNPYISDGISRVARTPIRKLGYDERFIRPIREANELGIEVNHLIAMVGMIFNYYDEQDTESHKLADKLAKENVNQVIKEVTGIKDNVLIEKIIENINRYAKLAA